MREELERVGLAAEAKRKPRQLSGGQQQRVALARALINRPAVLLLDEPLGALDLKLRKGLQIELKGIQREVGITFVYVTHDQEEALTMSDRIAVMNRGVIEQLDAPGGGLRAPAHRVRRGLHRRLEPDARARSCRSTATQVELRLDSGADGAHAAATACARGERCHAVVRPEKLRGRAGRGARTPPGSRASRASSSPPSTSAPRRRWSCGCAGDVPLTVLVPNADEAAAPALPGAGARVRLAWAPEHMHVVPRDGAVRRAGENAQ